MDHQPVDLPEFREWSVAAVRLLQAVVYHDDESTWDQILNHRSTLEEYFGRLGLQLVVDQADGFAFLKQLSTEELPRDYEGLPKLARSTPLSYGASLLCVLLREELRRFEDEDVNNERCVLPAGDLYDQWKMFFPHTVDDVMRRRDMDRHLKKLEELKFVRKVNDDPGEWEIRRILKARITATQLESLKEQFIQAVRRAKGSPQ